MLFRSGTSKEASEPDHAGNIGGRSVWFTWTPPISGAASFQATPSSFFVTNLIGIYTGFFVNSNFLTVVTNNSLGGGSFTNTVRFTAVAGQTYRIAVDGFNSTGNPNNANTFNYSVAWGMLTNDNFASPTLLYGSSGSLLTNSNIGATFESASGETNHSGNTNFTGGASVWFQWTVPNSGPATFAVSNFTGTPVFALYTGTNLSSLAVVASNHLGGGIFTNRVAFTGAAGTTYYIAVDGLGAAQSSFSVSYTSPLSTVAGNFQFNTNLMFVAEQESRNFAGYGGTRVNRMLLGAVVTFTRTNGATGRMMLQYTTADGTATGAPPGSPSSINGFDFVHTNGVIYLDDWQMYQHIVVPIVVNNNSTNNTYFQVLITNVVPDTNAFSGYVENPALVPTFDSTPLTVQINNQDNIFPGFTNGVIFFSRSLYRGGEFEMGNNGGFDVELTRVGGDQSVAATVRYRTSSFAAGSAGDKNTFPLVAGSDYAMPSAQATPNAISDFTATAGSTATFAANSSATYFTVPITDDAEVELNEDIFLELEFDPTSTSLSPSPQFSGTTAGYIIGAQSNATLTIVMEDVIGQEQPAGAQDNTYNRQNDSRTTPPFNPTPGANNVVYGLAVQPDQTTVIVGDFTAVNTTPRNRVARLLNDGSLDTTFNPGSGADGFINAVVLQPDGRILIAGGFSSFVGTSRNGVARLTTTGALDTTFDPGAGINPGDTVASAVQAIALQPDGRILLAGNFTTYNSQNFNRIVRLNTNGSVDASFNGLGAGPNDRVNAITVYTNGTLSGKILVAGSFTRVNGQVFNRLCRLNAYGSVDSTFSALGSGADEIGRAHV